MQRSSQICSRSRINGVFSGPKVNLNGEEKPVHWSDELELPFVFTLTSGSVPEPEGPRTTDIVLTFGFVTPDFLVCLKIKVAQLCHC